MPICSVAILNFRASHVNVASEVIDNNGLAFALDPRGYWQRLDNGTNVITP
jgi:hypothetical protein